jgi:cbb3-type cytochrome oxidase maturation protein
MSVIFLLIPISVILAAGFLGAFIWAVRSGQYEDTVTPALRVLWHDGDTPASPKAPPQPDRASVPDATLKQLNP